MYGVSSRRILMIPNKYLEIGAKRICFRKHSVFTPLPSIKEAEYQCCYCKVDLEYSGFDFKIKDHFKCYNCKVTVPQCKNLCEKSTKSSSTPQRYTYKPPRPLIFTSLEIFIKLHSRAITGPIYEYANPKSYSDVNDIRKLLESIRDIQGHPFVSVVANDPENYIVNLSRVRQPLRETVCLAKILIGDRLENNQALRLLLLSPVYDYYVLWAFACPEEKGQMLLNLTVRPGTVIKTHLKFQSVPTLVYPEILKIYENNYAHILTDKTFASIRKGILKITVQM